MSAESFAVTSVPVEERGVVDSFALTIPGEPRGQGRARIDTRGKRPIHIMDPGSRTAREDLLTHWIAAGRPCLPDGCWFGIVIDAEFARPASHLKRTGGLSAEGQRRPYPGKPDADNLAKLAVDALCSAGSVPDDARMVTLVVCKRWSMSGRALTRITAAVAA
ncbi:hypothetical protein [Microcystis phage Mae-JY09]